MGTCVCPHSRGHGERSAGKKKGLTMMSSASPAKLKRERQSSRRGSRNEEIRSKQKPLKQDTEKRWKKQMQRKAVAFEGYLTQPLTPGRERARDAVRAWTGRGSSMDDATPVHPTTWTDPLKDTNRQSSPRKRRLPRVYQGNDGRGANLRALRAGRAVPPGSPGLREGGRRVRTGR